MDIKDNSIPFNSNTNKNQIKTTFSYNTKLSYIVSQNKALLIECLNLNVRNNNQIIALRPPSSVC